MFLFYHWWYFSFVYILWGSPLLTTDINVACSAPIAVIVRHGAPRRNHDRGTHIRFTGDRVFHICQKESLISLEMPFYKTAELDNGHSIATHLKEVNNKPYAISLHAYSSKKIGKKEFWIFRHIIYRIIYCKKSRAL